MSNYVIVKDGKITERFESKEEEEKRYLELIKTDEVFGFREIRFNEMSDTEKIKSLRKKNPNLDKPIEKLESSELNVKNIDNVLPEELSWLTEFARDSTHEDSST